MPSAQPVSTANAPPLLSADLTAVQFPQSSVCTDDSTLPVPGMPAIQRGRQEQPSPHGPYLLGVGGDPVSTNYMAQVLHLTLQ